MYKTVKIKEEAAYAPAREYCNKNGIKLQHFISEAISEKIEREMHKKLKKNK